MTTGRGTGWVVAQTILIVATFVSWFLGPPVTIVGLVPAAAGFALGWWSFGALRAGGSLTPFPRPKADATLVRHGPYRFLRHPMYVAGVLLLGGASLLFSAWGLTLTAALGALWVGKARVEERLLAQRFPDYADYRRRTPF